MSKFTKDELLAVLHVNERLYTQSEYSEGIDTILIALQLSSAERDTLRAAYEDGPLDDGDVPSKVGRDELLEQGLLSVITTSKNGALNACTYKGQAVCRLLDHMRDAPNVSNRKTARALLPQTNGAPANRSGGLYSPKSEYCISIQTR